MDTPNDVSDKSINKNHIFGIGIIVAVLLSVSFIYLLPTNNPEGNTNAVQSNLINNGYGLPLTTDGENVFLYDRQTPLDLKTVTILSEGIIMDSAGVYFIEYLDLKKIEKLNPKDLRVIDNSILVNNSQVYVGLAPGYFAGEFSSIVANPSKLRKLDYPGDGGSPLFTDESKYYFSTYRHLFELPIQNPQLLTSSYYIKGTNDVYYGARLITNADPFSFTLVEKSKTPAKDDYYVYNYAKDKNAVYFRDKKITVADVASFKVLPSSYYQEYAIDNKYVYWNGEVIDGANPATFVVLKRQPYEGCGNGEYAKDNINVYFKTQKVKNADPKNFETHINGYAKDANGVYFNGLKTNLQLKDINSVVCYYG